MDIYLLDDSRNREHIVDRFTSFIWTERFSTYGDFEIVAQATQLNREIFVEDRWVVQNNSYRVMVIDTVEDSEDEEGRSGLNVSGRSLESVLEERLASYGPEQLSTNKRWQVEGTPADILRFIFIKICIEGLLDKRDILPNVTMDAFPYQPDGSIPESQKTVKFELELKSIYEAFTDICNTYSIGYCLLLHPVTRKIHFRVITGTNRTAAQSEVNPVVFSTDLDNLTKPKELVSSAKYKNVAVVTSEHGTLEVYADGSAGRAAGFKRRVLHVSANVKADDPDKEGIMRQAGLEELAKHRRVMAFDGELTERGHRYASDYFLGDIVEMRKSDGPLNYMRVTEQIFVDDGEGERNYPSLELDAYIGPGSWYSQSPNATWHSLDPTKSWDDYKPK